MSFLSEYFIAFAALLIIPIYYYYKKVYRVEKYLRNFPGPPKLPLLGNVSKFTSFEEMLPVLHQFKREYGTMVHSKLGPIVNNLFCTEPKFLEFLFTGNKNIRNADILNFLVPWLGNGLLQLSGPQWRMHRKLVTPAFHLGILEQFVDIFESCGGILVEKLSQENGNRSFDIHSSVSKCTLDAISETAMGLKLNIQTDDTSDYLKSVNDMRNTFIIRVRSIFKRYDFFYKFTKQYELQQKSGRIMQDYTSKVVEKKRQELKEQHGEEDAVDEIGRKKKKVFLDLILEAKEGNQSLTDEEIQAEVNTFMFGGHDTTAAAITFALYSIANNKEVQEKLLEEQRNLFGDDKNPRVTYKDLQEMKYLENVIKESLRLHPPVTLYSKVLEEDLHYEGKVVPKGLEVVIFVQGIHMDPKFYPEPEKFLPERFDSKLPPYTFMPFGAGPRMCIGQKYAMLEIKSIIAKVVRNFRLVPANPRHDLILVPNFVLTSQNGVRVGLELR